jgi:hypothetical protein
MISTYIQEQKSQLQVKNSQESVDRKISRIQIGGNIGRLRSEMEIQKLKGLCHKIFSRSVSLIQRPCSDPEAVSTVALQSLRYSNSMLAPW